MVADLKRLRRKVAVVQRRLVKAYGLTQRPARGDEALSTLINCILSQHTSDLNSDRAFEALRARFPAWEQVRDAPVRQVREAIRPAGLANQKAPRIQGVLREITHQRGQLNINFLRRMPVADARQWLQALNGVGPKTAAITLLFGLGCPAFPVDTHVHRVSGRLGLIPRALLVTEHSVQAEQHRHNQPRHHDNGDGLDNVQRSGRRQDAHWPRALRKPPLHTCAEPSKSRRSLRNELTCSTS